MKLTVIVSKQDILDSWDFGPDIIQKMREGFRPRVAVLMPVEATPSAEVEPTKINYPVIEYVMDIERIGPFRREFVVGRCGDVTCRVWQSPLT